MKNLMLAGFVMAGLCLAGCSEAPTRKEFLAKETSSFQCYCVSNAVTAETALLDCVRYAEQCQQAGVKGILYDEVFARIYGRLYLVARHLGHNAEAEQHLQKFAYFDTLAHTLPRQNDQPQEEMERAIEKKFDSDLQIAWKNQSGPNTTGSTP